MVKDCIAEPKCEVLEKWRKTLFLQEQRNVRAKGWLLSLIKCIEIIESVIFKIEDVYKFEDELRLAYPENRHVK